VAGPGDHVFRTVRFAEESSHELDDEPNSSMMMLRFALGLAHPAGELPQEGIIHHLELGCSFASRVSSLAGPSSPRFRTNCSEYSYQVDVDSKTSNFQVALSSTLDLNLKYEWNGETW
jgi:hypothetical protein